MPVPDTFDLTLPVLRLLEDGAEKSKQFLVKMLADEFALSSEDLERTRGDGRNLFQNRIEWARTWLKKDGLIEYPKQGWSQITPHGKQLLACAPQRLDKAYFKAREGLREAPPTIEDPARADDEFLEDELRRLCGCAVARDADWDAIRLLNGWGSSAPTTYEQAAKELGRETGDLLGLGRRCRTMRPDAPLLDATLAMALMHRQQDPDELALELVMLGLTRDAFSLLGLCEAARRFGRFDQWRQLLSYLSTHRENKRKKPRPFESWFELDVYLQLTELGYAVEPQKQMGRYRVDMYLPEFTPPVVVECDGDRYHRAERTAYDEQREDWLRAQGYNVIRFKYTTYRDKPENIRLGLEEILEQLGGGQQLRFA